MSRRPPQPSGPTGPQPSRPKEAPRPEKSTKSRVCRTPADAFRAGWDDGADDAPMTPSERARLVALLAPEMRRTAPATTEERSAA